MNALVTVAIGDKHKELSAITHPTMIRYADRINADFVCIDNDQYNGSIFDDNGNIPPHFAKMEINALFEKYNRIIYVDTDLIIRPDCPNLFDIVPEDKFGIFKEGGLIPGRKRDLLAASSIYSIPLFGIPDINDWKGRYYNTGVMVISKRHRTVLSPPDFDKINKEAQTTALDHTEQGWINLQLINGNIPIYELSHHFNRMSIIDSYTGEHRLSSFIVHYAGCWELSSLPQLIQSDIEKWDQCDGDYSVFRRGIYIRVGGGLGDQIAAEPVIRHIAEESYPDAEILVASDWPCIFRHQTNITCDLSSNIDNYAEPDRPYYKMETLPVEGLFPVTVSNPLIHPTDFSALSCIKTTLPHSKKQIKLSVTNEDIESLGVDTHELRNSIAVHPGRGWPSKTFPSEWWQAVVDGIGAQGIRICLIGKSINEKQGLVDVKAPRDSIDLRNKTSITGLFAAISQCRVCVSNDSSPIHIAGAFDNYIILIPTCKHPDHVMPWRHGTQDYKATSLYKQLTIDDICNLPTQIYGQTVDWVVDHDKTAQIYDHKCEYIKGGSILPYIPDPEDVITHACTYYKQSLEEQ